MLNPPITQLEKSIRALTTAIQLLQPQSAATETPIQPRPTKYQAPSKAYNHLAILLTQGSEADNGAGHQVVAVTGNSSSSNLSVSALEEIYELPSIPHMSFTQNADSGSNDGIPLKVQEIQPSRKTLEDLADPSKNLPTPQVPLTQHASDLFKALIDLSEDRPNRIIPFLQFVWLRCHRKIKHRLAADEVMLGMPLYMLLGEWKLVDSDVVEDQWFKVDPRLHPLFDSVNIPSRLLEETQTRQYQFSRSTIPAWCTLFIRALKAVKVHAARCDMQAASITELNKAFFTLNLFLYENRAFQTLLGLASLASAVDHAIWTAERGRRLQRPEKSFDVPLPDDGFDPDDPTTNPILRCCKAVLAWLRAGIFLSRSKLFRGPLPKFHVVYSYLPIDNSSMMGLRNLMMDVILPKLSLFQDVDNTALVQQLLDREDFVNKKKFTGKIHCEATLMALVHSFTSTAPPKRVLPFSKQRTQDLMLLFSNADRVIGVGKKSCFCCYWLAQLFQVNNDDGSFLVPGTHGIVFPWTPPVFGIPVSVLEQLEKILIQKLARITEDWIASQPITHSSGQSSPASQSSNAGDEDLDLDILDLTVSDYIRII